MTAKTLVRMNLVMVCVWSLLIVPTLLVWKASILWVAFMSLYANIASHLSAYLAARAEKAAE